jgi:hypothetical protein
VGLGATWAGSGITSSVAAQINATEPESRSVGYAENSLLPLGPYTTFRSQAVDATAVLIAYTRTGDANLDGLVNDDDVTVLGAAYAPGASNGVWALGDFEYNGFIDDDDVTLLGAFYNPAAGPLLLPSLAGPEERNSVAPAVRPGTIIEQDLFRSGGPTYDRAINAGPSDLSIRLPAARPGPYRPGYSTTPLRASENDDAASRVDDPALIDLLASAVATSGEDLRLSLARRMVIADSLWSD